MAHATGPLDKQKMDMKRYLEDENTQMYNSASALTSMAKAEVLADVITCRTDENLTQQKSSSILTIT